MSFSVFVINFNLTAYEAFVPHKVPLFVSVSMGVPPS